MLYGREKRHVYTLSKECTATEGVRETIVIGSWLGSSNGAHSLSKCLRGDDVVLVLRYHK